MTELQPQYNNALGLMKEARTHKYYFSAKALIFATILLMGFTSLFSFFIIETYEDNILIATIFAIPLIVILPIALPDYVRFSFYSVTRRPAVVISPDELVDNLNGQTYKWSEISKIKYMPFSGMNAPSGGYTAIILRNADKKIQISHNAIKCKTTEFLQTLIRYHEQNKGG